MEGFQSRVMDAIFSFYNGELGARNRKKLNEVPTRREAEDHCEDGDQYNLSIHRQFRGPEVLTGAGNLPADPACNLEGWELV